MLFCNESYLLWRYDVPITRRWDPITLKLMLTSIIYYNVQWYLFLVLRLLDWVLPFIQEQILLTRPCYNFFPLWKFDVYLVSFYSFSYNSYISFTLFNIFYSSITFLDSGVITFVVIFSICRYNCSMNQSILLSLELIFL